jgi:hypothetical protein
LKIFDINASMCTYDCVAALAFTANKTRAAISNFILFACSLSGREEGVQQQATVTLGAYLPADILRHAPVHRKETPFVSRACASPNEATGSAKTRVRKCRRVGAGLGLLQLQPLSHSSCVATARTNNQMHLVEHHWNFSKIIELREA